MARFIEIDGIKIDVLRKCGKKTLSLKLDKKTGHPQLSIPWLCPLFVAKKFVSEHIVWLKKSIEITPHKQTFHEGMTFNLLGKSLTIQHSPLKKGVFIDGNMLFVSGQPEFCHRRVKDFIKKSFYDYALSKAQEYAQQTNKKINHLTIRDTSSRWGSCSSKASISLCWRLALAPAFVADYVIAHEIAHLTQMNHSAAFWNVVKQINPNTYQAKKWLAQNSFYLHSFT